MRIASGRRAHSRSDASLPSGSAATRCRSERDQVVARQGQYAVRARRLQEIAPVETSAPVGEELVQPHLGVRAHPDPGQGEQ
jgi:hypothetical protein